MNRYIIIALATLFLMTNVAATMEISLSDLTLQEKIGQMMMVKGNEYDSRFLDLGVGGIFLSSQKTKEETKKLIEKYQENSKIPLLVSADLEGHWNPFPFFESKEFGDINTEDEAEQLGISHAEILKDLGFNLDFSPVVESKNKVWPGRSFTGQIHEIKSKSTSYIKGLQENGIHATAKHYPGGSMMEDPHHFKVRAHIPQEELDLFNEAIANEVSAIMIGHAIVTGAIDSEGRQATVSPEVISHLRKDFDGLIVTDAIGMWGLKWSYLFRSDKMFVDLAKAGNDVILDTHYIFPNYRRVKSGINAIVKAVEKGEISERQIDESVTRILKKKGYNVNV